MLSYQTTTINQEQKELRNAAIKLSASVKAIQRDMELKLPDSVLAGMIRDQSYWNRVALLTTYPYELLIYHGDSLHFWTQNIVIPPYSSISQKEGTGFQKFNNGFFLVIQQFISDSNETVPWSALALVPVKYEYQTSNSYLKPHFSDWFKVANYFKISAEKVENYLPVNDASGAALFYVGIDPADYSGRASALALVLFLAALVLPAYIPAVSIS